MIEMLSALEDNLLLTLPRAKAINTVHSTLTDTLRTVASRAVAESADATLLATTVPARVTNITEIVSVPFGVSGTQRAVAHYGFADAYTREAEKAMMDWKNAAEFDLVRSTLVSGVSGTAPKMTKLAELFRNAMIAAYEAIMQIVRRPILSSTFSG